MTKNLAIPEFSPHTASPGGTPRERLAFRTSELAVLAGRRSLDVTQTDYEQAKRDVTGESIPARQDAILDAVALARGAESHHGIESHHESHHGIAPRGQDANLSLSRRPSEPRQAETLRNAAG